MSDAKERPGGPDLFVLGTIAVLFLNVFLHSKRDHEEHRRMEARLDSLSARVEAIYQAVAAPAQ